MSFEWPFALLGLLCAPLLAALYLRHHRGRGSVAARLSNPALLRNIVGRSPGLRRHLPFAILLTALAVMVIGLARPHATVTVPREQATVVLALDVSRSMTATDVTPSRLVAARTGAGAFLSGIPRKFRVAVVSFASRAVVAVPPTRDRSLVRSALASLRPGEGTALGDAVVLSARIGQFEKGIDGATPPASVLLISDGARQGGRTSPAAAAEIARALNVPVYTVVLGTSSGVVERRLAGGYRLITRVPPSPATLEQIAAATGGRFFTATDDARLRDVYQQLGTRLGRRKESREMTDAFAGGSAALLIVGAVVSAFWFRRLV